MLERPRRLRHQQVDGAFLVDDLCERRHGVELLVLPGAVADAVVEPFPLQVHVEAQRVLVGRGQVEGLPEQPGRLHQRVDRRGVAPCDEVPVGRLRVAGPLEVLGDDRGVLLLAARRGADLRQPGGGAVVVALAMGAEHAVVGDVAQQRVLEQELARGVERRDLPLVDDLAATESVEDRGRRLVRLVEPGDGVVPEHATDDRCPLQQASLLDPERVQPGLEDTPERGGYDDGVDQLVDHQPVRLATHHDPGVEEPGDQLLHVEGIAVGRVHHQRDQVGGGSCTCCSSWWTSSRVSRRESAGSGSRTWWSSPSPHRGRSSSSVGRVVATTSTCVPWSTGSAASSQRSDPSSAQCRSSSRITTGAVRPSSAK